MDSTLTRHRHIYDAFREQKEDGGIDSLTFHFGDAYILGEDGSRVKLRKKSTDRRIVPTKLAANLLRVDISDNSTVRNVIRKRGNFWNLTEEAVDSEIRNYLDWAKIAKAGESYRSDLAGVTVRKNEREASRRTVMDISRPDRFVAKSCVEIAYGLNLDQDIGNLDDLRSFAIDAKDVDLTFADHLFERSYPFHFAAFHDTQFQFCFFSKYLVSVDIEWAGTPKVLAFAYDLRKKQLFECELDESGQSMRITDRRVRLATEARPNTA